MKILAVSAVIVCFDQITKTLIKNSLDLFESVPIIENIFHFTFIKNSGMAFGLNFPGGIYFFTTASLILTCVLFWMLWKERNNSIYIRLAFALIIGGAIGNLIDRILYGEVVDFLDFMIGDYHWYVFNIADTSVSIGMGILLIHTLLFSPKPPTIESSP